jgi:alanine racemase
MATATIDLSRLTRNVARIRRRLAPEVELLAAVKANAYGHGAVPIARHLASLGVSWFGVATPAEALELREGEIGGNVLIFSPVYDYEELEPLLAHDVALTLVDGVSLEAVTRAARKRRARVHLKVDTGMGRLGLPPEGAIELALSAKRQKNVHLEGVWTHFAAADDADKSFTKRQLKRFHTVLEGLERHRLAVPLIHAANSAAIFAHPESHFTLVRPGIALYGYHSSPFIAGLEPELEPILTLSAPVTFIKNVRAGTPISYGGLWRAPHDTRIATIRIGYADGYPRLLSNKGEVTIDGTHCPIVGRVCMDQLMIDIGELDLSVGDHVTLFGPEGIDAETLAQRIGTISYELLTGLSPRVERHYR